MILDQPWSATICWLFIARVESGFQPSTLLVTEFTIDLIMVNSYLLVVIVFNHGRSRITPREWKWPAIVHGTSVLGHCICVSVLCLVHGKVTSQALMALGVALGTDDLCRCSSTQVYWSWHELCVYGVIPYQCLHWIILNGLHCNGKACQWNIVSISGRSICQ